MRKLIALLLVCGVGFAQEKVAFEKVSFPFEGEVTATHLYVRMAPKSDPTSLIATTLHQGAKVTVVGEKEDFYQILPPSGCTAWVFAKNVKREGEIGVVVVNDSPVRLDSRLGAEKLCALNEGQKVKILAEHMGWFKIEAPPAVAYFVGKKFVKFVGEAKGGKLPAVPAVKSVKSGEDAAALEKIRLAETRIAEMNRKIEQGDLGDVDFNRAVSLFDEAAAEAKSEAVRKEAEAGAKSYRHLQTVWNTYRAQRKSIEEQIRVLKEEQAKAKRPAEKVYAFTGYIDTTSFSMSDRPGTHKLIMADKVVCFLKVKEGDEAMRQKLNNFFKKYVGVTGTAIKNPKGWEGYSLVIVDDVSPLAISRP